ncbi:MAG: DUF1800 domain-containing protein [Acidobacteriales bacterium]|nr:DUF1800 domain-containing protein [Terriglobales bacterium]
MQLRQKQLAAAISLVVVLAASVQFAAGKKKPAPDAPQMDEHKRAVHALNRVTFGPRPGEIERVEVIGVDKWIDQQLYPERINDSALDSRLAPLRTLRMDSREMVENFPPEPVIKGIAEGKLSLPRDPMKRAVYDAQLEKYEEKRERKQAAANDQTPPADSSAKQNVMSEDEINKRRYERELAKLNSDEILSLPADQRMQAILRLRPEAQIALVSLLKGPKRDQLTDGMNPEQRETVLALNNPQQVVNEELLQGKILRATYSERQLQEVLTDFWFNHFNVFIGKGADRYLVTSYERDVIRPRVLGKFEDLLVATAQSPAMLFYLDNWLSVGPNSDVANGIPKRPNQWNQRARIIRPPRQTAKSKRNGLNENYGRELMELHTLGVNGGYTQKDVTEVARVLTGWTLKQPREGGGFTFDERMHEPGEKVVLGHRIKSNGEKEGREVLHLLAHHPSTAKFICTKLAMRFVADNPPPALVDRMSQTFLKKDGDIREVLKTMLRSPEFWSPDAYRAKVKTPLEFAASALRASGAEITDAMPIARQLQNMGMQLYGMQPPTGYSMKADTWVNSSALLGRMNFALGLTAGKFKGVQVEAGKIMPSPANAAPVEPEQTLQVLENSLLAADISKQTHETIVSQLHDPRINPRPAGDTKNPPQAAAETATIEGLLLGSPEFQRR